MPLSYITNKIIDLTDKWSSLLANLPEEVLMNKRNWQNRTIKEVVGHLVDSATNNHHRIVRLQNNNILVFPDFRQHNDMWIALEDYQNEDWDDLIQLWKYYNRHIVYIIKSLNFDKIENYWYNFEGTKITLEQIVEGYLWHLELHLKEIEVVLEN